MSASKITLRDNIAVLSIDNGRSNAINLNLIESLSENLVLLANESNIKAGVLTGKDNYFSSGLDLFELFDYSDAEIKTFWNRYFDLLIQLTKFPKPLVAAINGQAPAAGCTIAMCADYRVMSEGKYIIGVNDVSIGLITSSNIAALYSFWLGKAKAFTTILEGKLFTPEEAQSYGLVNEVIRKESLISAAERQIRKYLQLNPNAWRKTKLFLREELIKKLEDDRETTLESILEQWWDPNGRSVLKTVISNLQRIG